MSSDTRMTEAIAATTRWQSCAIVEIATRTPAIKSFFLSLSETFDHTAGQHVDVRLTAPNGYTAMRSYSIASAPSDRVAAHGSVAVGRGQPHVNMLSGRM